MSSHSNLSEIEIIKWKVIWALQRVNTVRYKKCVPDSRLRSYFSDLQNISILWIIWVRSLLKSRLHTSLRYLSQSPCRISLAVVVRFYLAQSDLGSVGCDMNLWKRISHLLIDILGWENATKINCWIFEQVVCLTSLSPRISEYKSMDDSPWQMLFRCPACTWYPLTVASIPTSSNPQIRNDHRVETD